MWAQGQMKQDDWPEEARKDIPHTRDLNHLWSTVALPPSTTGASLCFLHTCLLSSLLINTLFASLFSVSLPNFFSKGARIGDLHQVVSVQHTHPRATGVHNDMINVNYVVFNEKKYHPLKTVNIFIYIWKIYIYIYTHTHIYMEVKIQEIRSIHG